MENRGAITSWSKNHRLPGTIIFSCFIYLIFFYPATWLADHLWAIPTLIQPTSWILSFSTLSYFVSWKNCAYFDRFVPYYQSFTLFWSLIFWLFNALTWHWFIRAILSWQNEWHFIILFQNIIIGSSYCVCGISRSSHRLHARLIFLLTLRLILILFINLPLWFRRLHLLLWTIYKFL